MESNKKCYRNILFIITILVDLALIYIYFNYELNFFDSFYIITILFIHLLFLYALYVNNSKLIDFLHYFVAIYVGISIFLTNKQMLYLLLIFIIMIQLGWVVFQDCLINKITNNSIGFGNYYSIIALIYTFIILFKIYYY